MEPPTSQLVDSLFYQVSHSHHIRSLLMGWDGTDPHLCVCVSAFLFSCFKLLRVICFCYSPFSCTHADMTGI